MAASAVLTNNPLTNNPLTNNPLTNNPLTNNPMCDSNGETIMKEHFNPPRILAAGILAVALAAAHGMVAVAHAAPADEKVKQVVSRGLDWLAAQQSKRGNWAAAEGRYPATMTALCGTALSMEGSTTTQGKYKENIKNAVDYLVDHARPNGLIGDQKDDRYTYGHGFSMLFLSQVLGEEEDKDRRQKLVEVLTKAVQFSGRAQTDAGGWGYVSAKDGGGFDEGSTTITQVQGLRGCRNAGIPVPKEIIDKAIKYIHKCTLEDGAVQYSSKGGGGRPAISAAAIACLFNAGDYDDKYVPKMMSFAEKNLSNISNQSFGHWHYAHYYFAQVMYRESLTKEGLKKWETYRDKIYARIISEKTEGPDGYYWTQGYVGPIYTTATNLTILQLENNSLPIYQR